MKNIPAGRTSHSGCCDTSGAIASRKRSLSDDDLRGALADSLISAFLVGLLSTGLALVLAGRLQLSITAPIRSLTEAMQETGQKLSLIHI